MLGHAKIILTFLLWYVIIELYENTYGKGKSNMKKIFPLFFLLIISALMLFSCTDDTECTHSWQAATCTSPETCELCGEVRGTPTEHDIVKQSVIAPTCTENGYTLYGCSACDFTVRGDHTYKTGHSFGAWVTNDSINLCDRERVSTRVQSRNTSTSSRVENTHYLSISEHRANGVHRTRVSLNAPSTPTIVPYTPQTIVRNLLPILCISKLSTF